MSIATADMEARGSVAAYRWATWLFAFSVALPTLNMAGWVFAIPVLRGLGNPNYAVAPLAVALFFFVTLSALLAHLRKWIAARVIVAVVAVFLVLLALRYLAHLDLGLEKLLFASQLDALNVLNKGVPGTGAISVMTLDCIAILLMTTEATQTRTWAVILASTSIGLTALTATMTLISAPAALAPAFIGRSTATSLPNFTMAAAILVHVLNGRHEKQVGFEYRLFRKLAPAIIVLPVFPSLAALLTVSGDVLSLNEAQFLVVACNILIVSLLLIIGLRSAARQSETVRLQGEQLRSILAGVPDAVIIIDHQGRSKEFSAAAGRLWRLPPETEPGCDMADYLGEREGAKLARLLAEEQPEFLLTGEGVREDGTRFPLELRGAAFRGTDGATCFTLFARDLSDKLAAEQHVARLGAQLAQVSRHNAMGELAADLAHELNQPLTAAINYLSAVGYMMNTRGDGTDAPEMVGHARNQIARAGEIIRRMREFAQHRDVEKRVERLLPMIEDAIQLVLAGTGGHHVDIELAVEPDDVRVFVDRIQVQQVVVNLLRNAVEALRSSARGRGTVVIAARQIEADWVEVQFRDDGPGVPDKVLDQLFERFTSTKAGAGMGIGLSISRRIVEAHGGTMTASNGPEGGASFCFTLPAATPTAVELSAATQGA